MAIERILVVDHESKWIHLLRQILTSAGYKVITTHKGDRAIQLVIEESPVLVITETLLLGEINGFELIRRVREFSDIPVIILSSCAENEDILRGFEGGADDYVTKPFDARILLARIRAVLNRSQGRAIYQAEIVCHNLVINLAARRVFQNGLEVHLTETEYNLLLELARHRDQVMLHEQLLIAVWGPQLGGEIDYLRSYVHILRRKLESNPSQPKLIISRPGIGYMLVSASSGGSGN
jgi:two-component system, OmpR family, KDP operon response regulator KdpE